ncbi:hypothetical protein SLE2022_221890 [Rubroshorea leprosula]
MPKSASFLDQFLQNDAAAARHGFTGVRISPINAISGGNPPFWFQCQFGLALTRGLIQNSNLDMFLPYSQAAFPRRRATGVLRHHHRGDASCKLPYVARSLPSSSVFSLLTCDIP